MPPKMTEKTSSEIVSLRMSVECIQDELKLEKRNDLIIKAQFENASKQEQTMNNELRTQMKNMLSIIIIFVKTIGVGRR